MKGFFFDTLLDPENICNLTRQQRELKEGVATRKKLVVYGPRNFGKTSVVKNITIPYFQRKFKKAFILFCDLMEVKSLDSIHERIHRGFEKAFAESFPKKGFLEAVKQFLSQLRPEIGLDPLTNLPTLSLGTSRSKRYVPFQEIFALIRNKIALRAPTCIVLDEFQDIALIPEAQGLFRQSLQEFDDRTSVILMGSKQHLLAELFAKPNAPLANYGQDIEFGPIPYREYHDYMEERFRQRAIRLDFENAKWLQDVLFRIPEAVNMVCAELYENHSQTTLDQKKMMIALEKVVENRRTRFEEWLAHFSEKEEAVLVALSKAEVVKQPTAKAFLQTVDATARTVSLTLSNLLNHSIVTKEKTGFRIADPLLCYFLKRFR